MTLTNQQIARKLRTHAAELAHNGDNLYRVRAFRQAAMAVMGLPVEVNDLLAASGRIALEQTPRIGKSIARTILDFLEEDSVLALADCSAAR
jgi:holliday junction DNA helicase RuvA